MVLAEKSVTIQTGEVTPEYRDFEGVKIQWNNVPWNFNHPELGLTSIDTYSIWNPAHHAEIATRLANGERVAFYMMGNFGVGQLFEPDKSEQDNRILDNIKQRDRMQNLVVFSDPNEIGDFIDIERLPGPFKNLESARARLDLYPGPMHVILPVKEEQMPNSGLVRQTDKTTAFFWIPGHLGYEQLSDEVKKRSKGGLFGGGSLNIHGQEPSYTTSELRDREMIAHPHWLENIDFVILDEFAESANIGRSHTQVSFVEHPARVVRLGSLSAERIAHHTGISLLSGDDTKKASSLTPYDTKSNLEAEERIDAVLSRIGRWAKQQSHAV